VPLIAVRSAHTPVKSPTHAMANPTARAACRALGRSPRSSLQTTTAKAMIPRMNVKLVRKVLITASFQSRVHFLRDQGKQLRSPTSGKSATFYASGAIELSGGRIQPLASTSDYHQNKRVFPPRNLNDVTLLTLTAL